MKKSTLAALLVPILLAGCSDSPSSSSGSSNGGSSSGTYTWQIVHLESVDELNLNSNCVIYEDSKIATGEITADGDPIYEVITAYKADDDYNILYHYQDGTIAETIEAKDLTDGLLSITLSDVPDDGYVTLEELSGDLRTKDLGSYMFSVQKDLLSDSVLNVPSTSGTNCITGVDHREDTAVSMFVNITQINTAVKYYQSSYDELSLDGRDGSGVIPVDYIEDATRDILVTAFESYDPTSEEKTALSGWTFIDSGDLFEAEYDENGNFDAYIGDGFGVTTELNNDDLTALTWSKSSGDSSIITLNDGTIDDINDIDNDSIHDDQHDSGVIVTHNDTTYLWQPIYESTSFINVAYEIDEVDTWNAYFSGNVTLFTDNSEWTFTSFNDLTDVATTVDSVVDLFDFDDSLLLSLDATMVVDNISSLGACSELDSKDDALAEPNLCIDLSSNFEPDQFTFQRLHIRLEDAAETQTTYQTIISKVNAEPVVLSSSEVEFTTSPTLTRIELNLMKTDDEDLDAVQYLMTQNIELESVAQFGTVNGDDSAESDIYNDLNGYVATASEIETLYQAVLKTNTTIVQSAYQLP